jgi:uncharacterized membrane protein
MLLERIHFCLIGLLLFSFEVQSWAIISLRKQVHNENDIVKKNCIVSQPRYNHPLQRTCSYPRIIRHLGMTFPSSSSASAAFGLTVASILGVGVERRITPSGTGILVSLFVSALASNVGWVPSSHALYDACWSWVLPTSLALLVLSQKSSFGGWSITNTRKDTPKYDSEIGMVGLAFMSAALSSFMGCTISVALSRILSPPIWLTSSDAAIAGGCLCASYIGGSVNFFATARHVITDQYHGTQDLLSSMAAADLLVMALYLTYLSTAIQNPNRIKIWTDICENESLEHKRNGPSHEGIQSSSIASQVTMTIPSKVLLKPFGTMGALVLALSLTWISNQTERVILPIAGMSCAMVVLGGSLMIYGISHLSPERRIWWTNIQDASEPLARWTFHAFFSAMGMEAHVGQALRYGPASLLFSGTAVILHVLGTLSTCRLIRKLCRRWQLCHSSSGRNELQLHHVLVASNAAIGGPATAAAFAGQQNHPELVVPATFWGVFGYAIGTTIGIASTRWYQRWL